ncbi:pancreatic lipase-related protein 2-like [Episyrphus balteatus]|uniref:pancreatic lipase-related protein 2-like n=1 Tax=Episyrphus balteatus TaxID=286459 RepID=UPI0024864768|nr:pancreatic lipase-related protein 2-like [Episyrphus balteatus]
MAPLRVINDTVSKRPNFLALPIEERKDVSKDGSFIPQIDGSLKWMSADEIKKEQRKLKARNWFFDRPVDFHLYTRKNPKKSQKISANNAKSLKKSNFNSDNPTRNIIHGWYNNYNSDVNTEIRKAFLEVMDCNVISVDWSQRQHVALLDDLHVIGHSLGAHVSGIASRNVIAGKVHTIIGLDPAGPLYEDYSSSIDECLTKDDARYVEVIHTNGGRLGYLKPIGNADFYVDGGEYQPGCLLKSSWICSHLRAFWYYSDAIGENRFTSKKCTGYKFAIVNQCLEEDNEVQLGGAMNYELASGVYYTPVNAVQPYGMG